MRTPSHAGRHPPEGRTHPRRQVFSHNGVPDGKALYRQVAALKDGLDVFITSWKNPDESMREVRFDDYIRDGVDAIVRVARDFSGADKVHAAGAQTFHTMHHGAADKCFVLSSSGHILGIVNPPVRPARRRYWAPTCTSLEAPCGAGRPDSDRIHQPRLTHFFISTGGTQNAHASCFDRTFTEPGHHRVSRKHGQQRVRTALGLQRLDYPAQAHHRGSGG